MDFSLWSPRNRRWIRLEDCEFKCEICKKYFSKISKVSEKAKLTYLVFVKDQIKLTSILINDKLNQFLNNNSSLGTESNGDDKNWCPTGLETWNFVFSYHNIKRFLVHLSRFDDYIVLKVLSKRWTLLLATDSLLRAFLSSYISQIRLHTNWRMPPIYRGVKSD